MRNFRILILLLGLLMYTDTVEAQTTPRTCTSQQAISYNGMLTGLCGFYAGGIEAFFLGFPTAITLVGNSLALSEKSHAPGWGITGVVASLIGLGVHAGMLGAGFSTTSCKDEVATGRVLHSLFIGLNLATFGVSVANLVFAPSRRPKKVKKFKLAPLPQTSHQTSTLGVFR